MAREDVPRSSGTSAAPVSRPATMAPAASPMPSKAPGSSVTNPEPEVIDDLVEQQQKDDEARIRAARNIFDAEEILED